MKNRTLLIRSILFSIPVILFILHQLFYHEKGLIPTGFSLDDDPVYISNARQYIDAGHFSLFYANPFDAKTGSPAIYLQPHNLFFALLMKMGLAPGYILTFFGLFFTVLSIFIGLKIIQKAYPAINHQYKIQLLFTWGGGLLALTGLLVAMVVYKSIPPPLDSIFIADPGNGWWGLNFGRTLFLPMEAYYHFLFLLSILLILNGNWKTALATGFFLALSHPFTGIEYLAIICTWVSIEKLFLKNRDIPWYFVIGNMMIILATAAYYLIYLNSFEEHKILQKQFSAGWTYSVRIILPAYILVLVLSWLQFRLNKSSGKFFSNANQRLFFTWGIIAFLLSKHEWFIKPMQPIHFTRGYIWMGLFLFAIPALVGLFDKMKKIKYTALTTVVFLLFFLSDNILWTINLLRKKEKYEWVGHLAPDTKTTLDWLSQHTTNNDLLFSNEYLINYLGNVYGSSYSWYSHVYNTPEYELRKSQAVSFLMTGTLLTEWADKRIIIVMRKNNPDYSSLPPSLKVNKVYENDGYVVFIP